MAKAFARLLAALTVATTSAAMAQPTGSRYVAWYPGDEEIIVDAQGMGWQECIGRGCSHDVTEVKGTLINPGVYQADNGYHYCSYPSEATRLHDHGRCTAEGWQF